VYKLSSTFSSLDGIAKAAFIY